MYTEDALVEYDAGSGSSRRKFLVPGIQNQLALGLSGRAEYVMPFFTIGVGLGTNVLGRGNLRGLYQVFALKINVTRSSFLHIGYNLQDFQTPNYLMLGLGFRFFFSLSFFFCLFLCRIGSFGLCGFIAGRHYNSRE